MSVQPDGGCVVLASGPHGARPYFPDAAFMICTAEQLCVSAEQLHFRVQWPGVQMNAFKFHFHTQT